MHYNVCVCVGGGSRGEMQEGEGLGKMSKSEEIKEKAFMNYII